MTRAKNVMVTIPIKNQLDTQFLLRIFILIRCMFRATLCVKELPDLHTGQSPTQSDIHQTLY